MQLRLSSLICRIIVLQKYTVCFQEEARLEDCEFYLTAQRFIVLPMERQRLESSDGYGPQGGHGAWLWGRLPHLLGEALTLGVLVGAEPSISQLIDAMGQDQLEVLKESAEKCLDLQMSKETPPLMVKDEVPITQWEAERKKEQGEDVFMVPANILMIPPEEEAVACDASKADTCEAAPTESSDERTVPGDPSVISEASPTESTVLSESSERSLDNPWNGLPPLSLTLNSSDERTSQHDVPLKTQQDVAADSNTPDLLEQCSQDSAEVLLPQEPVQTSSPSLLCSCDNIIPVETGITQSPAASDGPCHPQSPEVSRGSLVTPSSLSSAFSITPSSRLQPLPEGTPH
ncbi:ACD protein, partial [Pedionomus torquatus]|nr:ACD protein [Pedionomus torquatus]